MHTGVPSITVFETANSIQSK